MKFYTLILVSILLLAGCMPSPYYQKTYTIPQNAWQYNFQPSFKVDVTDTSCFYNIFMVVRHTDAYPFSNVWVVVHIKQPGDTASQQMRIEVPLSTAKGEWLGRGMGEIWEQRLLMTAIGDKSILHKKGTYEISLEQNMRVNPLPDMLQVGLRIEKGAPRNQQPNK